MTEVLFDHNRLVHVRREANSLPLGTLVAGHKKDVVPLNTWHTTGHLDYSHGVRLVHEVVWIDGVEHVMRDVLRDTTLPALLSDEGVPRKARYDLRWP